MLKRLFGLITLLLSTSVMSHPVIYKGGTVVSSFNMSSYSDNQLLYSFSSRMGDRVKSLEIYEGSTKYRDWPRSPELSFMEKKYRGFSGEHLPAFWSWNDGFGNR